MSVPFQELKWGLFSKPWLLSWLTLYVLHLLSTSNYGQFGEVHQKLFVSKLYFFILKFFWNFSNFQSNPWVGSFGSWLWTAFWILGFTWSLTENFAHLWRNSLEKNVAHHWCNLCNVCSIYVFYVKREPWINKEFWNRRQARLFATLKSSSHPPPF